MRSWLWVAWVALLGCGSGGSGRRGDGASDAGAPAGSADGAGGVDASGKLPGSVGPGLACETDADCTTGSRCLVPIFFGSQAYCAPPCTAATQQADCAAVTARDFTIEVPYAHPSGEGHNVWNTTKLSRGSSCQSPAGSAASFCAWGCPDNSALTFDDAGVPSSCACLPHFTFNAEKTACVWDSATECAILEAADNPQPCNACNSTSISECHTKNYRCFLQNNSFEGECVEWADINQLQECIAKGMHYNCNEGCLEGCISNLSCTADYCSTGDYCYEACCKTAPGDSSSPDTECGAGGDPGGHTDADASGGGTTTVGPWGLPAGCVDAAATCNPLDNSGCAALGSACDFGQDGIKCFDPPNDVPLWGGCDNKAGPWCVPGLHCAEGQCRRFCCSAADCSEDQQCDAIVPSMGTLGTCTPPGEG